MASHQSLSRSIRLPTHCRPPPSQNQQSWTSYSAIRTWHPGYTMTSAACTSRGRTVAGWLTRPIPSAQVCVCNGLLMCVLVRRHVATIGPSCSARIVLMMVIGVFLIPTSSSHRCPRCIAIVSPHRLLLAINRHHYAQSSSVMPNPAPQPSAWRAMLHSWSAASVVVVMMRLCMLSTGTTAPPPAGSRPNSNSSSLRILTPRPLQLPRSISATPHYWSGLGSGRRHRSTVEARTVVGLG